MAYLRLVTRVLEYAWDEGKVEAKWSPGREEQRRKRITQRRRVRRESAEETKRDSALAWSSGFLGPAGSRRYQPRLLGWVAKMVVRRTRILGGRIFQDVC